MTNNTVAYIITAIVVLALIGGGMYWYTQNQNSYTSNSYPNTQNSTMPINSGTQNNSPAPSGY